MRADICLWIDSAVWDTNPHLTDEGRVELARLRRLAHGIDSVEAINVWWAFAITQGVDPL
jgi:hypothetical protein